MTKYKHTPTDMARRAALGEMIECNRNGINLDQKALDYAYQLLLAHIPPNEQDGNYTLAFIHAVVNTRGPVRMNTGHKPL